MAARWLVLENVSDVPFRETVEAIIKKGFAALVDSKDLEIDFSGTRADKADFTLSFEKSYGWNDLDRRGCLYKPLYYGVTGTVQVEAIERKNFCDNVKRCDTCQPVFRRSADELGKMIGVTALHEIGHLLGLEGPGVFPGADGAGHSGDPGNGMFAITRHKDYNPIEEGGPRTRKYTIVKDDTLSGIAHRIGFWPASTIGWKQLYEMTGKDGTKNKNLLRGRDPNKIWPGEQIWIPDIAAWAAFYREAFLKDKSFSTEQVDAMRKFLKAGGSIIRTTPVPAPTP
jgi:hypothetical protein